VRRVEGRIVYRYVPLSALRLGTCALVPSTLFTAEQGHVHKWGKRLVGGCGKIS